MKRTAIASIACLWASLAFGQANNSNTWQTPGNQTVGGQVQMGVNAAGLAVGPLAGAGGYPPGATETANSGTATTGGIAMQIGAAAGQFTYLCGFTVSPGSATAAITININLNNIFPAISPNWFVGAPVTAAGTTGATLTQTFSPCLRSSSLNQQISLNVSALGAGGVNQAATMWGYTQ